MSKECTCTEEIQQMAVDHVANCGLCGHDEDGDIEPCPALMAMISAFEPGRSVAIWRDGQFQHYDIAQPNPEEGLL